MRVIQNPDAEYAQDVKKRLAENNGYCPCSIIKNDDTKCRCKNFRQQIKREEIGLCHCGLWMVTEDD